MSTCWVVTFYFQIYIYIYLYLKNLTSDLCPLVTADIFKICLAMITLKTAGGGVIAFIVYHELQSYTI